MIAPRDDARQVRAGTVPARVVGAFEGPRPGPLVVCMTGIHGNEWAGVNAARRVLGRLEADRPDMRGRILALAGNLGALDRKRRFVRFDLNRHWIPENVVRVRAASPNGRLEDEDAEMRDLLDVIDRELPVGGAAVFFLDFHTNSGGGPPFVVIGDTLPNRWFAMRLGLPVVLGLEEQIDGALLEYVNNRGHVTVGVEGGHHTDPASVDHCEAVLWRALVAAGCLAREAVPDGARHERLLVEATAEIPRIVEVRHRHATVEDDGFEMLEGYRSFRAVRAGETVARDRHGPIVVRERCRILLPRYQKQGEDGFFAVREISPLWLTISRWLRMLGAPGWVRWLPGVHAHPGVAGTLRVDTRVARFFPLQVFHLLGFRKRRWDGRILLVSRRTHDEPECAVEDRASIPRP